ncbi:IS1595 family transposase, partial [Helicobacter sp. T3_23-1059]
LLHLKETEFRYNTQIKQQDLYKILLKLIKNNPLKLS